MCGKLGPGKRPYYKAFRGRFRGRPYVSMACPVLPKCFPHLKPSLLDILSKSFINTKKGNYKPLRSITALTLLYLCSFVSNLQTEIFKRIVFHTLLLRELIAFSYPVIKLAMLNNSTVLILLFPKLIQRFCSIRAIQIQ